jgi:hypothetical protein
VGHEYRGQRIDNGEWVYGSHLEYDGRSFICAIYYIGAEGPKFAQVEVHPDSVGMWTGKCFADDKTNAYSGDLCQRKKDEPILEIKWSDARCGFKVYDHANKIAVDSSFIEVCHLIGNTIDNPELLKE